MIGAEACADVGCAAVAMLEAAQGSGDGQPAWLHEMSPEADVAELIEVRNDLLLANKRSGR